MTATKTTKSWLLPWLTRRTRKKVIHPFEDLIYQLTIYSCQEQRHAERKSGTLVPYDLVRPFFRHYDRLLRRSAHGVDARAGLDDVKAIMADAAPSTPQTGSHPSTAAVRSLSEATRDSLVDCVERDREATVVSRRTDNPTIPINGPVNLATQYIRSSDNDMASLQLRNMAKIMFEECNTLGEARINSVEFIADLLTQTAPARRWASVKKLDYAEPSSIPQLSLSARAYSQVLSTAQEACSQLQSATSFELPPTTDLGSIDVSGFGGLHIPNEETSPSTVKMRYPHFREL